MNDQCTCQFRAASTEPCSHCSARIAQAEDDREGRTYDPDHADHENDRWERSLDR